MNRWVYVASVIIFVGITGYVWYLFQPVDTQSEVFIQEGTALSAESQHIMPRGFPRPLILGSDVTLISGSLTTLSSTSTRYRIQLQTTSAPGELIGIYRTYFSRTFWDITTEQTTGAEQSLSAEQGTSTFMITATFNPSGGTQAMLEYIGPAWPDFSQ